MRSDADNGYRDFHVELRQEEREVVGIGRLEEQFGRTADAEPRKGRDLGVRRQAAADAGEVGECHTHLLCAASI